MPTIPYGILHALNYGKAAANLEAAFAEVETAIQVNQLFIDSALHSLSAESAALVPVGGNALIPAAAPTVTTSTGTALEAFSTYTASGGATSLAGSAAGSAGSAEICPVVVEKLGSVGTQGFAGPLGILSADVGVVGAALAPLYGVAIGANLYASNPELWEKISRTILPFAYPDSGKVPIFVDKDGNTYIDGEIVEALKDLFIDEGIGDNYKNAYNERYSSDAPDGVNYGSSLVYPEGGHYSPNHYFGGDICPWSTGSATGGWSGTVLSLYPTTTYVENLRTGTITEYSVDNEGTLDDGRHYYSSSTAIGVHGSDIEMISIYPTIGNIGTKKIAEIIYGTDSTTTQYGYPEGTSQWGDGNPIDYTDGKRQVFTNPELTDTMDIYPIALTPNGSDVSLPNGSDITQPDDRESQVDYYDLPDIVPFPDYEPDFNPNPDPEEDPSTDPETKPEQQIQDIDPPIDTGETPYDPTPIVPLPTNASVNGLIAVYHPTPDQLYAFGQWLWVTYADASDPDLIWNNPFDGVIGCHELYCTPTDIGYRNIKCGFLDSGINSAIISRYTEINCGNIVIPEYYRNYLDYAPYTSVHIYLPFVGIVQVNADDIIGHAVNITYRIDEYNGSCIAMIRCAKQTQHQGELYDFEALQYQFEGNCAVEVPLSGGSQANIKIAAMTGILQVATSTVGGAFGGLMSGNAGMAVGGAVQGFGQGLASAATTIMHAKSSVQKSGQFGASYGAMGVKNPFIIVNRPVQVAVLNYNLEYGFPAHKFVTIGSCTGYLRCREVNVISARATNEEKTRIEQYLKTGVFVQ